MLQLISFRSYFGNIPTLNVADTDIIKEIMVKQFSNFTDRWVGGIHSAPSIRATCKTNNLIFLFCIGTNCLRVSDQYRIKRACVHTAQNCGYIDKIDQGPVVQSTVSLTTSLRCQFVKYMPTTLSNPLLFFVGKIFSHFSNKN